MDTLERLRSAVGTGELVSIRYNDGSNPGAAREIAPLQINANGRVRARCYTSNAVKVFEISRIVVLDAPLSTGATDTWRTLNAVYVPPPTKADDVGPEFHDAWSGLGWLVKPVVDEDGFTLGLHRPRKDHKGYLKSPTIALSFTVHAVEFIAREDGSVVPVFVGERSRKWTVRSLKPTRTFGRYESALAAFVAEANEGPGRL